LERAESGTHDCSESAIPKETNQEQANNFRLALEDTVNVNKRTHRRDSYSKLVVPEQHPVRLTSWYGMEALTRDWP